MSAGTPRIVGIVLVRNEDVFIERAVRNAAAFCDEWILTDHESRDGTAAVLRRLAAELPSAAFHPLRHASESHALIQKFAGTPSWIFAVDGDEIYDPEGLARLRGRILAGEFDRYWMILGNVLNMTDLAADRQTATGHLSPPCRSMTKLYHFGAISAWDGYTPERLHGGKITFRPGYSNNDRRMLHEEVAWEDSDFRCLHACFLQRSSLDPAQPQTTRQNSMEVFGFTRLQGFWLAIRRFLGFPTASDYKRTRYMRGPAVTVPVGAFFPVHS
ncbi:MAG TPA: glycosyltransferase family 2 protein [Terrimicrobiaceae bacterium]|nr:glycosyltransferase family 2 protein [Terrimicrobiaceae bacterium]